METENSYELLNESLELNSIEESPLEKTANGHTILGIQSDNPVSGYGVAPKLSSNDKESWQTEFLKMMPAIERQRSFAFQGLPEETREDFVEEVIVHALRFHPNARLLSILIQPLVGDNDLHRV